MSEFSSTSVPAPTYAPPVADLARLERRAWIVGLLGTGASVAGWFLGQGQQFLQSWLIAWMFWFSIALGCLALAMVHHMSRGAWGLMVRRILEAAFRTLPFVGLLFIPILLNIRALYLWADPANVAGSEVMEHKAVYLNQPFFIGRAIGYFVIWSLLAWGLARMSRRQDEMPAAQGPRLFSKLQLLAGPGLVIYALTVSFAAIDWLMSLDPKWFSSIWGAYLIAGQGIEALCFIVLIGLWLNRRKPMKGVFKPVNFHDYGKLMLAFTMLWAYFAISQYLIIWAGNLPEEISWFVERRHGGWAWMSVVLAIVHFFLPFLLLLSRDLKRDARRLAVVAVLLLGAQWLDFYWQAAPAFSPHGLSIHWLHLTAFVGIGGLWLGLFFRLLAQRSLLPVHDPYLEEALQHG